MTWNCTCFSFWKQREGECMTKLFLINVISYWWFCSAMGSARGTYIHITAENRDECDQTVSLGVGLLPVVPLQMAIFADNRSLQNILQQCVFADLVSRGKRAIVSKMFKQFSFKLFI